MSYSLVFGTLLTGCSSSSTATSPATPATSSSLSASRSPDAIDDWCNSYGALIQVLSEATTSQTKAQTGVMGLDRFAQLWKLASEGEIITPDEANANLRAVGALRKVLDLIAAGQAQTSPDVVAAQSEIKTVTENDHELLQSSAGKVLALCGTGTPSATPSGS
jgi:hypothetical protein